MPKFYANPPRWLPNLEPSPCYSCGRFLEVGEGHIRPFRAMMRIVCRHHTKGQMRILFAERAAIAAASIEQEAAELEAEEAATRRLLQPESPMTLCLLPPRRRSR